MRLSLDKILSELNAGFVCQASVTPFLLCTRQNSTDYSLSGIDYKALRNITDDFLEYGNAVVFGGTTGESFTLSMDEHESLLNNAKNIMSDYNDALFVAGTGSNATHEALKLTRAAESAGADLALIISPYAIRPSQEGYYNHVKAIVNGTKEIPIILYECPHRTNFSIEPETVKKLHDEFPNRIVAIKDAGNDDKNSFYYKDAGVILLSGDDKRTHHLMTKLGATGVISVASHIAPFEIHMHVHEILYGNGNNAAQIIQRKLNPLIDAVTKQNPESIKAALYLEGKIDPVIRQPLTFPHNGELENIKTVIGNYKTDAKQVIERVLKKSGSSVPREEFVYA